MPGSSRQRRVARAAREEAASAAQAARRTKSQQRPSLPSLPEPVPSQSVSAAEVESGCSAAESLIAQADWETAAAQLEALSPVAAVCCSPSLSARLEFLLSQCRLAAGDAEASLQLLRRSLQRCPHEDGDRWMQLSQMTTGQEAVQAAQRGIAVYRRQREEEEGQGEGEESGSQRPCTSLSQVISTALVSAAELYVTDCCDAEGAEAECERLLQEALTEWPDSTEAAAAMANLRLLQQDEAQARHWTDRCWRLVQAAEQHDTARLPALQLVLGAEAEAALQLSLASSVSYELRLNVAKLCYELGELRRCRLLLRGCLEQDDRFVEPHHLAALACLSLQRPREALSHADTALRMVDSGDWREQGGDDAVAGMRRALLQLRQACTAAQQGDAVDDDEGEDEDEDEADDAMAAEEQQRAPAAADCDAELS